MDVDLLEVRPDEVYGPAELRELIQQAQPGFDETIIANFSLTGMRHGEGLGLMWPEVDFDGREISIIRSWENVYVNGLPHFTTPKTKKSIRKIPISDELVLALKKWKLQCPKSEWNLVFPQNDGRPQHRKTTWRAMRNAVRAVNMPSLKQSRFRNGQFTACATHSPPFT